MIEFDDYEFKLALELELVEIWIIKFDDDKFKVWFGLENQSNLTKDEPKLRRFRHVWA